MFLARPQVKNISPVNSEFAGLFCFRGKLWERCGFINYYNEFKCSEGEFFNF